MASHKENCSMFFKSCVMYVFHAFFFFGADPSLLLYFAAFAEFDPMAPLYRLCWNGIATRRHCVCDGLNDAADAPLLH
jgi:hypothetical protein